MHDLATGGSSPCGTQLLPVGVPTHSPRPQLQSAFNLHPIATRGFPGSSLWQQLCLESQLHLLGWRSNCLACDLYQLMWYSSRGPFRQRTQALKQNKQGVLVPAPGQHSLCSHMPDAAPRRGSLQSVARLHGRSRVFWSPRASTGPRYHLHSFGYPFKLKIHRGVQSKEAARVHEG